MRRRTTTQLVLNKSKSLQPDSNNTRLDFYLSTPAMIILPIKGRKIKFMSKKNKQASPAPSNDQAQTVQSSMIFHAPQKGLHR
jgi:hypothetical protein